MIHVKCEINGDSCVLTIAGFPSAEATKNFALSMRVMTETVIAEVCDPRNELMSAELRLTSSLVEMLFAAAGMLPETLPERTRRMGLLRSVVCSTIATLYAEGDQFDILDQMYQQCGSALGAADTGDAGHGLRGMVAEGNA